MAPRKLHLTSKVLARGFPFNFQLSLWIAVLISLSECYNLFTFLSRRRTLHSNTHYLDRARRVHIADRRTQLAKYRRLWDLGHPCKTLGEVYDVSEVYKGLHIASAVYLCRQNAEDPEMSEDYFVSIVRAWLRLRVPSSNWHYFVPCPGRSHTSTNTQLSKPTPFF